MCNKRLSLQDIFYELFWTANWPSIRDRYEHPSFILRNYWNPENLSIYGVTASHAIPGHSALPHFTSIGSQPRIVHVCGFLIIRNTFAK